LWTSDDRVLELELTGEALVVVGRRILLEEVEMVVYAEPGLPSVVVYTSRAPAGVEIASALTAPVAMWLGRVLGAAAQARVESATSTR
jgi:hypothetical protein